MFWEETWVLYEKLVKWFWKNKWLYEILSKLFWDGKNLIFLIQCNRLKCKERIGKNEIKIGLMVWILRMKWRNEKNQNVVLIGWHGRVWTFCHNFNF